MIKKDIVFAIVCILWLSSSFCAYFMFDQMYGVSISNLFWIIIMCVLIVLKNKTNLGKWLEETVIENR